jgi:putative sterol carrier protein
LSENFDQVKGFLNKL